MYTPHYETWNTCPERLVKDCRKKWKDEKPTVGVIHRTRICEPCLKEIRARKLRNPSTVEDEILDESDY